jgi:hypothetical protein
MFGTARTQDGVTDITVLMDGIARAGASLVRIQREVKLVKSALATLGRVNGESLLD